VEEEVSPAIAEAEPEPKGVITGKMTGENANLIAACVSKPEKKNLYIIATGRVKMRTQIALLFVH
jgi:hypothetical protein